MPPFYRDGGKSAIHSRCATPNASLYNRDMVYVLPLSDARHALVGSSPSLTEPAPAVRSQMQDIVLIQRGKEFTHLARGTFQRGSVTLAEIQPLTRPIQLLELPEFIPKRLLGHALRVFRGGGRVPPKTSIATLAALAHLMPEMRTYLYQS